MRKLIVVALLSALCLAPATAVAQVQVQFLPGVRVMIAPPPPRYEPIAPAPSSRHQWISGYWGWSGTTHVWVPGHWAMAPAYGYVWEPARWENVQGAWMFYDGHWRPADQPEPAVAYQPPPPPVEEVVVDTPPPPPIVEVQPAMPFGGAVWVPGYWHWNGSRHMWVSGRWSARPAGYGWEEGRWEHRGDGKWVQRPGHWHAAAPAAVPPGHGHEKESHEKDGHDKEHKAH